MDFNTTIVVTPEHIDNILNNVLAIVPACLLVLSEVLPFIESVEANGLVHAVQLLGRKCWQRYLKTHPNVLVHRTTATTAGTAAGTTATITLDLTNALTTTIATTTNS